MRKFIISEEERAKILSMHVDSGYKTEINEQQGTKVGDKVADPNAEKYKTPHWEFLLKTNVPAFFTKNNIDFEKVRKYLTVRNVNGGRELVLNTKDKPSIWVKSGGDKYEESYDGYSDEYEKAYRKVWDAYKSKEKTLKRYSCFKKDKNGNPMKFYPFDPKSTIDMNSPYIWCKNTAEELDRVFKDSKLKGFGILAQIEKFINQARKLSA